MHLKCSIYVVKICLQELYQRHHKNSEKLIITSFIYSLIFHYVVFLRFSSYFNYVTQLINDTKTRPHKYFITIKSFTMEPVPLFNRARFVALFLRLNYYYHLLRLLRCLCTSLKFNETRICKSRNFFQKKICIDI